MRARAEAAAATGERILAVAWEHFATRPYDEVLLRNIAADAAVTVQTIHTRFGSKDDLHAATYRWWGQQETARRDAATPGDVPQAIHVVFDHYEAHGDAILRMQTQEDRIAAIRRMTDIGRAYHRDWTERMFAPVLDGLTGPTRERQLRILVVATDVYIWKLLRRDMQLQRAEAELTVAVIINGSQDQPDT